MKKFYLFITFFLLANIFLNSVKSDSKLDITDSFPNFNFESLNYITSVLNPELVTNKSNNTSKKNLIDSFCKVIIKTGDNYYKLGSQFWIYEGNQSVFLYLLCNNQGLDNKFLFPDNYGTNPDQYFRRDNFKIRYGYHKESCPGGYFKDQCLEGYSDLINLPMLANELLVKILGEFFLFQQARIIGLNFDASSPKTLQKKMDDIAFEYFFIPEFCSSKTHNYPQTCKIRSSYIKKYQKTLQQLDLFRYQTFIKKSQEKESQKSLEVCKLGTDEQRKNYDILLCGTLGETESGMKPFLNAVYNEIFRYQYFLSYYSRFIDQLSKHRNLNAEQEMIQMEKNQTLIYKSLHESIGEMINLENTFMVHIGFLAYQEDLLRLRDNYLSKIITPFYTLYEKFRNAQKNE